MGNKFSEWIAKQPKGAMTRVFRASGVSMHTLHRLRKGEKVGLGRAIRISRATNGEVAVADLTNDRVLEKDDESHAA